MKGVKYNWFRSKKVNSDDLIEKYKGNTADVKFDKFDSSLNTINKIQNSEIDLDNVKNNQEKLKLIFKDYQ